MTAAVNALFSFSLQSNLAVFPISAIFLLLLFNKLIIEDLMGLLTPLENLARHYLWADNVKNLMIGLKKALKAGKAKKIVAY